MLLDLLYWDSRVAAHEKYGEGQYDTLASSTKPKGGGGTTPSCVSRYLQENAIKPECVVMLTDGSVVGMYSRSPSSSGGMNSLPRSVIGQIVTMRASRAMPSVARGCCNTLSITGR